MSGVAPSGDGRTARRDRNRDAVLDAVIDLFAAGVLDPPAPEVAARSGVSLRSVHRYFEDREALVRAAIARNLERTAPLFEIPGLGEGPFAERVDRFVAARLRLYDAIAPMARAALRRAPSNPIVAERLEATRTDLQAQLEAMFAPELGRFPVAERRAMAAAADVLCGFEALEHLRVHRRFSAARAREVLRRALTALLDRR